MADPTTEKLYQEIREWLTENGIPIAHSVENFNALINTFYGREKDGVFAFDLMKKHFDVYTLEDGSIDPQAAADINTYLEGVGAGEHAKFDATASTDSGPISGAPSSGTSSPTDAAPKGIMGGGKIQKINRDGADPLWAISYSVGGANHLYTFNSYEDMVASLGTNWAEKYATLDAVHLRDVQSADTNSWIIGDADVVIGQQGQTYQAFWNNMLYEQGLAAGSRNPGLAGEYARNPEIQNIMAMAAAGGWSQAQIDAEIARNDWYLNTYKPGIATFINQGMIGAEAVQAYNSYTASVEYSLEALGYERDGYGTFRSQVGQMLGSQISAEEFNNFAPTFIRAEQSQEYAAVLDQWTQRDLGISLDFDNWFDVLAGSSTPELDQVVEKATIQFQADRANTSLSADQITRLAELTQLSEGQLAIAFSNAEESLLSVGQADLERYGLSQEMLVNAAFGVESGSMSSTDVQRQARKAATELGIQDDEKAGFFLGFDRFARPNRQGLLASAPEAG